MVDIAEFLQNTFHLNQLVSEGIAAVLLFAIIALVGWVAYFIFSRYFSAWAKKTKTTLDDEILHSIRSIVVMLIILAGAFYALTALSFIQPYSEQYYLPQIFETAGVLLTSFAVTRVTNILIDWVAERNAAKNRVNNHLLFILRKVLQLVIYVAALLVILTYVFHQDLSGVVVGLGVGGIAIALALESTLSDVFSAFSIYFDRPFEIGDFIVIGEHSGTVKSIGIKSTRVILLQGEELVLSNKELTSTAVRNFKKLQKRRINFKIGVTYDTSLEKLKKIPKIISDIVDAQEYAEIDRVHFYEFADFSLKIEVVYYVTVSDYTKYMDIQQAINFGIKEAFEKEGIEMAFPTQTIYLAK
ncbi:MAG: mechanosensitive ion channel family protein [Candidatus Bathyarchaeota archaeon]|nr:mechanosensitive ion channel family protein [Candidatus Bathyarchaeota archaeon]